MMACVDFRESYKKEPKRPEAEAVCEDIDGWPLPAAALVEDGKREEEIVKNIHPTNKIQIRKIYQYFK
jgi:hypothetical protein